MSEFQLVYEVLCSWFIAATAFYIPVLIWRELINPRACF